MLCIVISKMIQLLVLLQVDKIPLLLEWQLKLLQKLSTIESEWEMNNGTIATTMLLMKTKKWFGQIFLFNLHARDFMVMQNGTEGGGGETNVEWATNW